MTHFSKKNLIQQLTSSKSWSSQNSLFPDMTVVLKWLGFIDCNNWYFELHNWIVETENMIG